MLSVKCFLVIAGMTLVTALVQVAVTVNSELDNSQRQLDAERKKPAKRRGMSKLDRLEQQVEELSKRMEDLRGMMSTLFCSVFVHRYRDIRPEIRALRIAELGVWMQGLSAEFLKDNYLKYIGWTLFDKVRSG